jgi:tetratricopeptide (TPR) repeat protein
VSNLDVGAKTRQQILREKLKRKDKTKEVAKRLESWLSEPESSVEVEIAHVLQSIEDNRNDIKQLPLCSSAIGKFTNKAINTNQAGPWLKAIKELLQDYHNCGEAGTADLYISKYICLQSLSGFVREAEECLQKAIELCGSKLENIEASLLLAIFYENISEYKKMKGILSKCELLSEEIGNDEKLAKTYVLFGHYYFYMFNFAKARNFLKKAASKIEKLGLGYSSEDKWIFLGLNNCWHYIGRTYFEEYDFVKAASFYVKAQNILEENCKQCGFTESPGAIAFYHLRLAQILDACQIKGSAEYHYQQSNRLFIEQNYPSGLAQVNLALANSIGDETDNYPQDETDNFKKQEKEIKDSAAKALKVGYIRGEGMALLQMLDLYVKNRKIYLSFKLIGDIIWSKEVQKLGGLVFLLSLIYKLGLKQYNKIKFYCNIKVRPHKTLRACPCPDPKCKSNQENIC